jgi:hypothetical protein
MELRTDLYLDDGIVRNIHTLTPRQNFLKKGQSIVNKNINYCFAM